MPDPTNHTTMLGHELDMAPLPEQTTVIPVNWPDDGRLGLRRPIWRERGEWTDGRTRHPILESDASYLLLHVPAPPMPGIGGQLSRPHLDQLPARAVVRNSIGWVAQLAEHEVSGLPCWTGLISGGEVDSDLLWRIANAQLWLVWLPEERSIEDLRRELTGERIGDGPEEWER